MTTSLTRPADATSDAPRQPWQCGTDLERALRRFRACQRAHEALEACRDAEADPALRGAELSLCALGALGVEARVRLERARQDVLAAYAAEAYAPRPRGEGAL